MTKWVCLTPTGAVSGGISYDSRTKAVTAAENDCQKPFAELFHEGYRVGRVKFGGSDTRDLKPLAIEIPLYVFRRLERIAMRSGQPIHNCASIILTDGVRNALVRG